MVTRTFRQTSKLPVWDETSEAVTVATEWLNAAVKAKRGAESYLRVTGLIKDIREIEAKWGWTTQNAPDEWNKLNRKSEKIKRMLTRYSFYPVLDWLLLGKRWQYRLTSLPAKHDFVLKTNLHGEKKAKGVTVAAFHGYYEVGEADVVYRILDLAAASELQRIRQCETCGRWFYAYRSHQRFCSQRCQLKQYSTTPHFKNYRRRYMRQLRSTHQKVRRRRG